MLAIHRNVEGAIAETRKGWELDPLSIPLNNIYTAALSGSGHVQETIDHAQRLLELSPNNDFAYVYLSQAYRRLGRNDDSARSFIKAVELRGHASWSPGLWATYRHDGLAALSRREAEFRIAEYRAHPSPLARPKFELAEACLTVGNRAAALPWLQQTVEERSGVVIWLNINDDFRAAVAADPAYRTLVSKISFPRT